MLRSLTSSKKHWRLETPTSMAFYGLAVGWEAPSLLMHPVFSLIATSEQTNHE